MSDRVFAHAGDNGDLIAQLTVIAGMGGGRFVLYPHPCTGNRMTQERAESLIPLLERQPYIHGVEWQPSAPAGACVIDHWRSHYRSGLNLADMACTHFGVPHWPREHPWIMVPEVKRLAKVIFARSPRYWNWNFPWKYVWEQYHLEALFVGHPEEHAEFVQGVGPVAYCHTRNYLELAQIIAGAEMVCVNQTSIFWLAEALKVPVVLEVCGYTQNCHCARYGQIYSTNEHVGMPPVESLTDHWAANMAKRAEGHTVVTEDRLKVIARSVRATERLPGDMAELGTYQGGTAKVIASVCPHKRLHVFDTFAGIPHDDIPGGHTQGEFAADFEQVKSFLAGHAIEFHVGFFPATAAGLEDNRYSFVHLDGDLYETTKAAIAYFWPCLVAGGIIVFDDWKWPGCPGVERAITEAGLYELVEETAPQQCWIRKP